MKRGGAALVGGVWIRPAVEQHFHDGEIPRPHRLMEWCDRVAVPSIDGRTSLDEQGRDPRRLRAIRAPKVCDSMESGLSESIRYKHIGAPIEEVSDNLAVQRLGSVE